MKPVRACGVNGVGRTPDGALFISFDRGYRKRAPLQLEITRSALSELVHQVRAHLNRDTAANADLLRALDAK